MHFNRTIIISGIVLLVCACAPSLYMPSETDAAHQQTSLEQLLTGRTTYVNKCSSCHSLFLPQQFTKKEWQVNVNKMQNGAKINDVEKESILKYLSIKAKEEVKNN